MTTMLLRLHPVAASPARRLLILNTAMLSALLLTGALLAGRGSAGEDFIRAATGWVVTLLAWAAIAVQLLLPDARRRSSTFAMTLPLSGRRLWATSLLRCLLDASVTAVVLIFTLEAGAWAIGRFAGRELFRAGALLTPGLWEVLAAALLAATLLHLPAPGAQGLSLRGWMAPWAGAAVGLPGCLLLLLGGSPATLVAACVACAVLLALWGARRVPAGLLLSVDDSANREPSVAWMPPWTWLTAARWTMGLPTLLVAVSTTAAFGVLQAVLSGRYSEEDETGLLMAPMLVYIMTLWLAVGGRFLHRLSPLPVSRGSIAALLTLPVLAASMTGYGFGLALEAFQRPGLLVEYQREAGRAFPLQKSERSLLRLPAHRFEIAWSGQAPDVRAPWGESHRPWQARIWKGASPVLFSPLSTSEAVTPEFAAWQISQGLELVYGAPVPHERIRATHVGVGGDGHPVLLKKLEDLVPGGAAPRSPLRSAVPPLTLGVCGTSYLLLAGILFGLRRVGMPAWKRTAATAAVMIGLMALYVIRIPLSMTGLTRGWILGGALSSMARSGVSAIPGGVWTLWLISGAAVWLAFRFAVARLEKAEILAEPPRRFGF